MYCATVVAFGFDESILPHRVLNSAKVMSDVQHFAVAAVPLLAGLNGVVHLLLKLVARMFVVV